MGPRAQLEWLDLLALQANPAQEATMARTAEMAPLVEGVPAAKWACPVHVAPWAKQARLVKTAGCMALPVLQDPQGMTDAINHVS